MSEMNWNESENWYAPLEQRHAAQAAPSAPAKKRRGWIWIPIVCGLLTLALIFGSVLLFANRAVQDTPAPVLPRESVLPSEKPAPSDPGTSNEEGMPKDRDTFFKNFYEESDTAVVVVNIQRMRLAQSVSLELSPAPDGELSLQELYEKCSPSIVAISGYMDGKSGYNWGTGIILTEDGLILTNTHVLEDCDRATVKLYDDREFDAMLIGADTISDIAVLKIEASGLPVASFGDSGNLLVGDKVAAIGNPLGETFRSTLTDGIISAIARGISYKGRSMTLLQTNTALNEGNSGGALFNMYGQVIGVTNMKMMSSSIEGIGFAIPSATVVEVVNNIIQNGEVRGRPSIGITVGVIPEEAMKEYSLPSGLYISDVVKNSDAYAKGIRAGDILLEVNHIPVSTTAEVSDIKSGFGVGDSLTFTIWRDGEIFEVDVVLMDNNDVYG